MPCRIVIMALRSDRSAYRPGKGKTAPPDETFAEAAYLKELGEKRTPVAVKLATGETVRGWIEYYDQRMIRLTREGAPNLFIYKHDILYIAEAGS